MAKTADNRLTNNLDPDRTLRLVLLITTLIKMAFALKGIFCMTDHDIQLIDISTMTLGDTGHPAYMNYLIEHRAFPPVLDIPNTMPSQFYHPPVFYIIGAILKFIVNSVGGSDMIAYEVVQQVNMIFACLAVYVVYLILRKFDIKGWLLTASVTFAACNPIFYIIGAELNNDCLMTLFCLLSIYFTICWHRTRALKDIILSALTLALGMLTKTSAVLIAPAIGAVFIYDLVKDIREKKLGKNKTILQYLIFAVVSIPPGMSWVVRNLIVYNIPFSYVPKLPTDNWQFLGNEPFIYRFIIPSIRQFTTYADESMNVRDFCNLFGQMMRSMFFDEEILFNPDPVTPLLMLWTGSLLMLFTTYCFVRFLFEKAHPLYAKLLMGGVVLVPFASFVMFSIRYPFICTIHVRYIVSSIVCLLIGATFFLKAHPKHFKVFMILCAASSLFACFDYMLY